IQPGETEGSSSAGALVGPGHDVTGAAGTGAAMLRAGPHQWRNTAHAVGELNLAEPPVADVPRLHSSAHRMRGKLTVVRPPPAPEPTDRQRRHHRPCVGRVS